MPRVTGCGEIEEIERGKVYRIRHHLGRDPKTGRYLRSPKRTVHGTKSDRGGRSRITGASSRRGSRTPRT